MRTLVNLTLIVGMAFSATIQGFQKDLGDSSPNKGKEAYGLQNCRPVTLLGDTVTDIDSGIVCKIGDDFQVEEYYSVKYYGDTRDRIFINQGLLWNRIPRKAMLDGLELSNKWLSQ